MSKDTKMMTMLETMMISFDKSFQRLDAKIDNKVDALESKLEIMLENQDQKIDILIEGLSIQNDRMESFPVDHAELKARALKLEAEVFAIKKKLNIA